MKAITVNELEKLCKEQIKLGNGSKTIMISQDDEGNGYHYLWYSFSTPEDVDLDNTYISENVASLENTIILG